MTDTDTTTQTDPRITYAVEFARQLTEAGREASALVCGGEAVDEYVTDPTYRPDADQSVGVSLTKEGVDWLITTGTEPRRNWGFAAWDSTVDLNETTIADMMDLNDPANWDED